MFQVDQLDSAARYGGAFNQPQYLHLKESLSSVIQQLNNLQVGVWVVGCAASQPAWRRLGSANDPGFVFQHVQQAASQTIS